PLACPPSHLLLPPSFPTRRSSDLLRCHTENVHSVILCWLCSRTGFLSQCSVSQAKFACTGVNSGDCPGRKMPIDPAGTSCHTCLLQCNSSGSETVPPGAARTWARKHPDSSCAARC